MAGDFNLLSCLTAVGHAYLPGLDGLLMGHKWRPDSQRHPKPYFAIKAKQFSSLGVFFLIDSSQFYYIPILSFHDLSHYRCAPASYRLSAVTGYASTCCCCFAALSFSKVRLVLLRRQVALQKGGLAGCLQLKSLGQVANLSESWIEIKYFPFFQKDPTVAFYLEEKKEPPPHLGVGS